MLEAQLVQNHAATADWSDDRSELRIQIPTKRPRYLVPPISWVVRPPKSRTMVLDRIGSGVWSRCDGQRTVEQVIEEFAADHRLTFHEGRVAVTGFAKSLIQRGALVVLIREVQ